MSEYLDEEWDLDDWNEQEKDKGNWSEWALWQGWCDKYEWEDIDVQNLEPHEVIVFRDLVFVPKKSGRGKKVKIRKYVYVGERLHIAEWIKIEDGFMFLKTIYTEGDRPLKPGTKTKRKVRNAVRFGLKRIALGQGAALQQPTNKQALNRKGFDKPVYYASDPKPDIPVVSRFQKPELDKEQ
jgi:hypothetical protein